MATSISQGRHYAETRLRSLGASYAKLKHRLFTTNDLNDFAPQRNGTMV